MIALRVLALWVAALGVQPAPSGDDVVALLDVPAGADAKGGPASRVLFVELDKLTVRSELATRGTPSIAATPRKTFLIAQPSEAGLSSDKVKTEVLEYDPSRKAVVARYEHPYGMARFFTERSFQRQLCRVGSAETAVWLMTEEFDRPRHSQQRIEFLDWPAGKILHREEIPDADWNRTYPFSLGKAVLLLRDTDNVKTRTEARLYREGTSEKLELNLEVGDRMGSVASSGSQVWGVTVRSGKLFGVQVGAETKTFPAKPIANLPKDDRGVFLVFVLPDQRLLLAMGPNVTSLDRLAIVDPASSAVVKELSLPAPASGLVSSGGKIFAVGSAEKPVLTAYDLDLAVKAESAPLVQPKAMVSSGN